ncbi:hypothetical protein [Hornefia porci]|uniref:hypothetical protein n=1 Tax=Hornefia porci TaxID=2652292 RepID=UPI001FE7F667|nr:hypothetical protein [Hornefia porci]
MQAELEADAVSAALSEFEADAAAVSTAVSASAEFAAADAVDAAASRMSGVAAASDFLRVVVFLTVVPEDVFPRTAVAAFRVVRRFGFSSVAGSAPSDSVVNDAVSTISDGAASASSFGDAASAVSGDAAPPAFFLAAAFVPDPSFVAALRVVVLRAVRRFGFSSVAGSAPSDSVVNDAVSTISDGAASASSFDDAASAVSSDAAPPAFFLAAAFVPDPSFVAALRVVVLRAVRRFGFSSVAGSAPSGTGVPAADAAADDTAEPMSSDETAADFRVVLVDLRVLFSASVPISSATMASSNSSFFLRA